MPAAVSSAWPVPTPRVSLPRRHWVPAVDAAAGNSTQRRPPAVFNVASFHPAAANGTAVASPAAAECEAPQLNITQLPQALQERLACVAGSGQASGALCAGVRGAGPCCLQLCSPGSCKRADGICLVAFPHPFPPPPAAGADEEWWRLLWLRGGACLEGWDAPTYFQALTEVFQQFDANVSCRSSGRWQGCSVCAVHSAICGCCCCSRLATKNLA